MRTALARAGRGLRAIGSGFALRRAAVLVRRSQHAFRQGRPRDAERLASHARWWLDCAGAEGESDGEPGRLPASLFAT